MERSEEAGGGLMTDGKEAVCPFALDCWSALKLYAQARGWD